MKLKRGKRLQLARLFASAALGWLLMAPGNAGINALDNVPGATLLLPYFEVDVSGQRAGNLMFTVHNADSAPHIAHVTLWTDAGIPTFSFDVYLAGKDLVDIDLRAVFAGIVPHTSRTLANVGAQSSPNVSFPGCDALLPTPRFTEQQIQDLRAAHTGLASGLWGGQCGACAYGDQKARGYLTVDVANRCSLKFPGAPAGGGDPAYFVSGGTGIASNANVLWGEYRIVDNNENQAYADLLVSIEADNAVESGYTFYGRRVNGDASDNRERLPAGWDARYVAAAVFEEAYLQIWRDAGMGAPWPCGGAAPALSHRLVWAFDEEENPALISDEDPSDGVVPLVPRAASRLRVGEAQAIPTPSPFGFVALDLRLAADVADPLFGGINQSHVSTIHKANGRFGGLMSAWPTATNSNFMPDFVIRPFPSLLIASLPPSWICPEGTGTLTILPSGDATLEVTAPAGPIHLRYNVVLNDNFNVTRQVTGQIPSGGGVWLGPPAETVKTTNLTGSTQLDTAVRWGFHEVVAPFAPFDVQFFVPGGSASQSKKVTVSYAGEPFPGLVLSSVSCSEGTVELGVDLPGDRVLGVRGPHGVPLHLNYVLGLTDTAARSLTGTLGTGVWLGPPAEAVKTGTIEPGVAFSTSALWGSHEVVSPFTEFIITFNVTAGPSLRFRVRYLGEVP